MTADGRRERAVDVTLGVLTAVIVAAAALEASDDPATAALARFYRPAGPGS